MSARPTSDRIPHLISPRADAIWFCLPGVVAALAGAAWGLAGFSPEFEPLWLWIGAVLLVDVAHVYASLYRTYLDKEARQRHKRLLIAAPLGCLWIAFLLHLESPALFWTVLAYLAVFHFIKQHEGFAMLYVRKARESAWDRRLAKWAIWAGTACPVVYWHVHLPRQFTWFIEGDLLTWLAGQTWLGTVALAIEAVVLLAFVVHRVIGKRSQRNPILLALVLLPALNWNLGIVVFNDDAVFTLTNVLLHGIPYLALVFIAGGRDLVAGQLGRRASVAGVTAAAFYGLLAVLAFAEEAAWDRLVWGDHPQLFGESSAQLSEVALAFVVALLTVPQATHYILDRYIWRAGPKNPDLARQLSLE